MLNEFGNFPAPDALGADKHCFICTAADSDSNPLQVRFEFSTGDTSNFGSNASEILGLTTNGDRVSHRETFATDFTDTRHGTSLSKKMNAS